MNIPHFDSSMCPHLYEEEGDRLVTEHGMLLYRAQRCAEVCENIVSMGIVKIRQPFKSCVEQKMVK